METDTDIYDFSGSLQENLLLEFEALMELEALKGMRIDMGHFLEAFQFVRKDLQRIAENLEVLEALNEDLCHSLKKEAKTENVMEH